MTYLWGTYWWPTYGVYDCRVCCNINFTRGSKRSIVCNIKLAYINLGCPLMPTGCYMFTVQTKDFDATVLVSSWRNFCRRSWVDGTLAGVHGLAKLLLTSKVDEALAHDRGLTEPAFWPPWVSKELFYCNSFDKRDIILYSRELHGDSCSFPSPPGFLKTVSTPSPQTLSHPHPVPAGLFSIHVPISAVFLSRIIPASKF